MYIHIILKSVHGSLLASRHVQSAHVINVLCKLMKATLVTSRRSHMRRNIHISGRKPHHILPERSLPIQPVNERQIAILFDCLYQ